MSRKNKEQKSKIAERDELAGVKKADDIDTAFDDLFNN